MNNRSNNRRFNNRGGNNLGQQQNNQSPPKPTNNLTSPISGSTPKPVVKTEKQVPELSQEATFPVAKAAPIVVPAPAANNKAVAPIQQAAAPLQMEGIAQALPTASQGSSVNGDDAAPNDGISPFKYFFKKKRFVRRKEKKLRQNRRLRKMLTPKTALMALNELKGSLFQYNVTGSGSSFSVEIVIGDQRYEGFGNSKIAAKNNASEKALRELVIQKMSKVPKAAGLPPVKPAASGENEESTGAEGGEDVEMKEVNEDDEDEVPMIHLASFALHKLFSEWEAQGFKIPDFRVAHGNPVSGDESSISNDVAGKDSENKKGAKKPQTTKTELPANHATMHPCMLLSFMRPSVAYSELGSDGSSPNDIIHRVGVTVDGKHYIGAGRSKKLARKSAAITICNEIFGTQFVDEIPEPAKVEVTSQPMVVA